MDPTRVRIESERLVLVPVSPAYREDIFREFTDEITLYMVPPTPASIAETDEFIAKSMADQAAGTELTMMITKHDGEFIGCCGLHRVGTATPKFGIWTKKSSHGNKYGREAIAALKAWADEHLQYDYIEYPVAKANTASRKIAESLGATVDREFTKTNSRGILMDEVMYHIPRSTEIHVG